MTPGRIAGIDHVSLPMQQTEAMVAFYRALGFDVAEHPQVVSVYAGSQMINFHRPAIWPRSDFTLRAPAAEPPCGDLCFVWEGSHESLLALLRPTAKPPDDLPGTPGTSCRTNKLDCGPPSFLPCSILQGGGESRASVR